MMYMDIWDIKNKKNYNNSTQIKKKYYKKINKELIEMSFAKKKQKK